MLGDSKLDLRSGGKEVLRVFCSTHMPQKEYLLSQRSKNAGLILVLPLSGKLELRVPWTARRSNQSILKEISSEYSLEGLILKLKFQYFGPLMRTADSLEKTLMLGKIESRRKKWLQRMR